VRLPSARSLVLLVLLLAGVVTIHGLMLGMNAHGRFQESVFATVRARVTGIRASLGQRVALGGGFDRAAALQQAAGEGEWEAIEAFSPDGRLLAAVPGPATVNHWVTPVELEALRAGAVLVGAEPFRQGQRVLAYALLATPSEQAVLRFTAASPELAEDRAENQQMFLAHGVILLFLLLAGGIVMAPTARESDAVPPRALVAYEEAMERLRDHGEEQTVRHAEERRQMEDVLRDKEALARAGELTAGIVHEVRNGLGTILGYARLIENGGGAAPDSARSIREECETLEAVIARFVDFVKRETLTLGPVDLARMLERVATRESRRLGATIAVDAANAGSVVADEGLLERAFENLVRNARDAAGAGGRVWVSAARTGDRVTVTVADDGPGIGPATREKLRPFFSTKPGGLGLGLPIALKIVRLHDGALSFGDRVPRGAAVTVRLPAGGPGGGRAVTDGSEAVVPEAGDEGGEGEVS
jgi:signal transduction histidine kinase